MDPSSETLKEIDASIEEENKKKIEAVLFIAGKFMSIKQLISLTEINPILLKKALYDLKDKYKDSGIQIIQKEDLWKMDVSPEYTFFVNKLATGSSEFSKAEQETLAIIAYKQPIKQSVIVKIRGNKAYDHIKKFYSLGLIAKKKAGHTYNLVLKDEFYDYFHMNKNKKTEIK